MRIAQLRERRGWKKTELARQLGISRLLGLADVRTKKNLDVAQLNISEEAAIVLASGKLDDETNGCTVARENTYIAYRGRSKFKSSGVMDLVL